ncbi:hypothetical protein CICLE_v10027552mg [Citrus x clementina]|uniref:Uncharacterized protein n=1 Tax=Citrus clementina TaxID=85681 RepID=V4UK58_CITCL|nr:hypothetical protein CICLE_v10027552mg [Citrus x clementina]
MNPNQTPSSDALTLEELSKLETTIKTYHTFPPSPNTCTSLITQKINTPLSFVWPFVRDFTNPDKYKNFIRSCKMKVGAGEVGPPATTSTERLEMLDDENHILSFRVLGGDHRLQNYRSVTSVNDFISEETGEVYCVVLESYVVDIPEGNSDDDTRLFVGTVVKLNLARLADLAMASFKSTEEVMRLN